MWLMLDGAQHIFQLMCATASMLHIQKGGMDAANSLWNYYTPQTSIRWISSTGVTGLKSLDYETPLDVLNNLTAQIVIALADISRITDLFK
ncbi:hypothetical protein TNCV_919871 [Trichonephila clavipes]|nr:hypothetical protein TNCV_919871 [Trichonephila clavipes]